MYHVGGNLFLNLQQKASLIFLVEMGLYLLRADRDRVRTSIPPVRKVVVLFLALYGAL